MSLTKRCMAEGIRLVDSRDMLAGEILELEKQLQACEDELRREDRYALRRRADGLRLMLEEKREELRRMNGDIQADALPAEPPAVGDLVREPDSEQVFEVVDVLERSLMCRIAPEFRQPEDNRAAFEVAGQVILVLCWEDRPKRTRPERPKPQRTPKVADPGAQLPLF